MAYFDCVFGGGSSGGGYELTVTCDADFAGTTITCTDGVTTLTQTCPSASPYEVVFAIPNGGEWTVSGVIGSASYSTAIDIPDSLELHSVPEGSTVLPTDDIQTWLACAGITDKSYTTLNEVLADSTTLLALISDNNASDYLVRSTTWASGITADSTAMTDIGANNYCANTLLSDSTWRNAICNSTYFESVLNTKVPTMTSNTAPSGEVIGTNIQSSSATYYYAFDNNNTTTVNVSSGTGSIGYIFTSAVVLREVDLLLNAYDRTTSFKVQGSNDGSNWIDIHTQSDIEHYGTLGKYPFANSTAYSRYRLLFTLTATQQVGTMQFYGRADV